MARINLGHPDLDCMAGHAPADRDNQAADVVFRMELH